MRNIKMQLDKMIEYMSLTTIPYEDIETILGISNDEEKETLEQLIDEYISEGKLSTNTFGIFIERK